MQSGSKPSLPFQYLKDITNNFAEERILGKGSFGVVFKGLQDDGKIVAVKKLLQAIPSSQEQFENELILLMNLEHQNIVRLVGHCYETEPNPMCHKGKSIFAWDTKILLCLEYLPNGSLDKYISDASSRLNWHTRWKVIEGISYGLQYLHEHPNEPIIHLDLKPANILLDANMLPKVTDFGLSRMFYQNKTIHTASAGGTLGYMPPEYLRGIITPMWDIFSLGVIIMEVITGHRNYPDDIRKDSEGFIELELKKWRNRLQKEPGFTSLENDCQQIERCIQIGLICVNPNRNKRPTIKKIIDMLEGTATMNWYISNQRVQSNRLNETKTMEEYIKTSVVTSQKAEHAPNVQHHGMPNSPRETSSKENATGVTVVGTSPCNTICQNTANLDKLNETMHSLNPDIRRCFEFCSIFPRGSKLIRDDLVRMWIAQGFVKTSCATEDMEDIARGYIQDLVSISFLEPSGTTSDTYCFTVHHALHDILDKAAVKCYRIENARSNKVEVWDGDVPRDIQHLFIQHYDGELITGKIIGLEHLRTLIVYTVGKETRVKEKVIDSICKRLPNLRVLAFAFSNEHGMIEQPEKFSFPKSVGKLKCLRYLAFRTYYSCKITLPSTLNQLQHIQILDFGHGDILKFTFAELVSLRHIFCWRYVKLAYLSRLSSLQTLSGFKVSNEQGCDLRQLRDLNKLQSELFIWGLGNVKSKGQALQANLRAKGITELLLWWSDDDDTRCSPEVESEVLEGLCPPAGLQILSLRNFVGGRYPNWMVGKLSGGPKDLQELQLWKCSHPGPASGLAEAFPHLRVLRLLGCSWNTLPDNMDHLTLLKELDISSCGKLRSLPSLPQSLENFRLAYCNDELVKSCQTVGNPIWQKIKHIPEILFW